MRGKKGTSHGALENLHVLQWRGFLYVQRESFTDLMMCSRSPSYGFMIDNVICSFITYDTYRYVTLDTREVIPWMVWWLITLVN